VGFQAYNLSVRNALYSRVLVLNRLWQAIHIVDAKRALCLLFMGHARVLCPSEDSWQVWPAEEWISLSSTLPGSITDAYLHSVGAAIRVPRIVILNQYAELPLKETHLNRQSIFERDGYRCQYCGKLCKSHELNLDHVMPKERGGAFSWQNIVSSCLSCNSRKANRTPREANMHLLKKPRQPKSRPFVSYMIGQQMEEEWESFLQSTHDQSEVELIHSESEKEAVEVV
jgi:5-methylcytosine-specific restriction endonuclease McrA